MPSVAQLRKEYQPGAWERLRVSLVRIYNGVAVPPRLHVSKAQATTVALWHILEGEVSVRHRDLEVNPKRGNWMVCLPGERFQVFAKGTRILSIHLRVDCEAAPLHWTGPQLLALAPNAELERATAKLRKVAARWGIYRDDYADDINQFPFPGALEIGACAHGLLLVLIGCLMEHGVRCERVTSRDPRVRDGLVWLADQPLSQPFSRASLAKRSGLSASHLDRLWREEIGTTPYQFWENRRLRWACERLRKPEHLIKTIAFDLGFGQVSQFSTWFRIHQGESPRAFRARPSEV